ncbi:hypothetical protein CEXT_260641 [Caerostris extrusa]|uniref:Uncharacterized protein n=1 Tax=Caerostris extrusa TaxID=172846 RepID=A0AAV4XWZ7_CAEEX|nr:hypothetical protein CEXT_260641 [Caerostris extrusa]
MFSNLLGNRRFNIMRAADVLDWYSSPIPSYTSYISTPLQILHFTPLQILHFHTSADPHFHTSADPTFPHLCRSYISTPLQILHFYTSADNWAMLTDK